MMFELKEPLTINTNRITKEFTYVSRLLTIYDGKITINSPFKWNGITKGINTKKTYRGGCVHDALNVARPKPLDNKTCDLILLDVLKEDGSLLAYPYYYMAKWFGNYYES